MVWTQQWAPGSELTGPSRHWMSNVDYTKQETPPRLEPGAAFD
jgi:hypothetical protein